MDAVTGTLCVCAGLLVCVYYFRQFIQTLRATVRETFLNRTPSPRPRFASDPGREERQPLSAPSTTRLASRDLADGLN